MNQRPVRQQQEQGQPVIRTAGDDKGMIPRLSDRDILHPLEAGGGVVHHMVDRGQRAIGPHPHHRQGRCAGCRDNEKAGAIDGGDLGRRSAAATGRRLHRRPGHLLRRAQPAAVQRIAKQSLAVFAQIQNRPPAIKRKNHLVIGARCQVRRVDDRAGQRHRPVRANHIARHATIGPGIGKDMHPAVDHRDLNIRDSLVQNRIARQVYSLKLQAHHRPLYPPRASLIP